jgi:hypothetical protein
MVRPDEAVRRRQFSSLWQNKREAGEIFDNLEKKEIHQQFVTGRPNLRVGSLGFIEDELQEAEFVPDMPVLKKRKRGVPLISSDPANSRARNNSGDGIDDNSSVSDRTTSIRADYEAEERGGKSAVQGQTDRDVTFAHERLDPHESNAWSGFITEEQHARDLAFLGRWAPDAMFRGGRGGGRGDMLKGATWEYDASIKLESKPTDLFPVSNSDLPCNNS